MIGRTTFESFLITVPPPSPLIILKATVKVEELDSRNFFYLSSTSSRFSPQALALPSPGDQLYLGKTKAAGDPFLWHLEGEMTGLD